VSTALAPSRWSCEDCGTITVWGGLLVGAHPFDEGEAVYGCPACKGMELVPVCDERGCKNPVSCGTPTADGYRSTCGTHRPERVRA
jgi:hypothetical protein